MSATLTLNVKEAIVAGETIELRGYGEYHSPPDLKNVSFFILDARSEENNLSISLFAPIYKRGGALVLNADPQSSSLEWSQTHVSLPLEGDWPVMADLGFKNGTMFSLDTSEATVHVEPRSYRAQERFNRISEVLTVTLTIFAFIESIKLIRDFETEQNQTSKSNTPNKQNTRPNKAK